MKKAIMITVICLMSLILSGCMAGVANITINEDDTIEIFSQMGVSEATINALAATSEEAKELKQQTRFIYNGVAYYGEIKNPKVDSIEAFNKVINESNEYGTDQGGVELTKLADGRYRLALTVTSATADTSEIRSNLEINGLSQEKINQLMNDMVMIYTFNMPGKVTQTFGSSRGITISGNRIEINFLKLDIPTEEGVEVRYEFETQPKVDSNLRFIDVPESLWSYKAINVLAEGGLVAGVGDGRFSPERGMKISEFCQVLVNANGLESGSDENGYWAAKAIKSCIDKGYIYSHGEIKPEIYDAVITREEAIAAMQLASGRVAVEGKNITIENIPDGDQIDPKYKDLILKAYNSGITTGVNEQLKFSPKNKLTRGQVCQLFYNVDWTTKNNE